jgi:hypothetical protein
MTKHLEVARHYLIEAIRQIDLEKEAERKAATQ